ncbi:MAG: hypothetical protein AB7S26_12940 [Sandaracinaceae bacterium]
MAVRGVFAVGVAMGLGTFGCGPAPSAGGDEQCEATAGGEEGSADELSELMSEMLAPRICQQVTGAFIGLPGDEGHDGAEGGIDPAVGRWWIRRCSARVDDGRLHVSFGGPGWTWLDRESTGFRVRQYLRFEGDAALTASLHVGYDRRARVATVWLRPEPGVTAEVRPTGLVRAEATGVFSAMLGGILDLTGNSASNQAQVQAAEEGSQRLAAKLQTGFTVTFALDTEQLDFMLGQLPRGLTPVRPWESNGAVWLVNERSAVWPGGVDVIGPIPADAGAVTIDVELEEGDGAVVRRVCEEDMYRWLEEAWAGRGQGPPRGDQIAELRGTHQVRAVQVPERECDGLLVVTPIGETTQPVLARYRVSSDEARAAALEAAEQAMQGRGPSVISPPGPGPGPVQPQQVLPQSLRIEIRNVSVAEHNAEGGDWDMFGGEPDPYVVVTSIAQGRELHRTEAVDDSREARFDRLLPNAVRLDSFPIRFVVYDEDVAGDEVVGSADLEASQLGSGAGELTLDLRSQGATPRRTGAIRLRLTPQP